MLLARSHFVVLLKSNFDVQQTHLFLTKGQFVEQMLELSNILRYDQIHNKQ